MYNFDVINDRRNTNCLKFDFAKENNMPEDLVSMWIADMDFMAPDSVINALKAYVDKGIFGYSDPKDDYFEVVISWFKKHFDWEIRKEWIVKTPGVVIALAIAVRAFTEKGDAVIIQPPVKQALWACAAFVAGLFILLLDSRYYHMYAYYAYVGALIFTAGTIVMPEAIAP
ncbi:MAG: hypothetical protein II356_06705, partial [Clostridia bacterium]|nr:hypothetical protein [Clostridia bacterium]